MSDLASDTRAPLAVEAVGGRSLTTRLADFARHRSYALSALLLAAAFIATVIQENGNIGLSSQLAIAAPVTIAALASTPAIIGGGFDLSISPLLVFTNCVYVVWLAPHGLGGAVAVPIVLGVGLLTGLFTGLAITILRVQPVVVTLAMYFALQGVDLLLAPNPVSLGEGHRWIYDLAGSVGPVPGATLHDRRTAADLGRAQVRAVPPPALRGRLERCHRLLGRRQRGGRARRELRARRPLRRHRRALARRARAVGERGQLDAVRAPRHRGARARRHVARGWPGRPDRRRLRCILDLPAAEPAGELPGQPGVAADRLRRGPDRRRRDPGCADPRDGHGWAQTGADAGAAPQPPTVVRRAPALRGAGRARRRRGGRGAAAAGAARRHPVRLPRGRRSCACSSGSR